MRSSISSMLIMAAAVIGLCSVAAATAVGTGWVTIKDVNDTHIQELGRWAVSEHVKLANDGLRFVKVVSGRDFVYYGVNYELVIEATKGAGKNATYEAAVYDLQAKTRQLLDFKPRN